MTDHRDLPPTHTTKPMNPPPASDKPTTAMLKGDIDSGRTGDKNEVFDPGLSPQRDRTAPAYREAVERWRRGARASGATHDALDGFPGAFAGFIVAVGVVLVVGILSV